MSNKYLIQALRAYRQEVYGQFDEVTFRIVQETQDAAEALEKADARIAELENGLVIKFTDDATPGVGMVSARRWRDIKARLEAEDKDGMVITAIQADQAGVVMTWEYPRKEQK